MPLAAIIALIPEAIKVGKSLAEFIGGMKKAVGQTGEWTPEVEAEIADEWQAASKQDHWKTDAQLASE